MLISRCWWRWPFISLLKIGRLGLLEKPSGKVFIPDAVHAELTADKRFTEEARATSDAPYIKTVPVSDPGAVRILRMAMSTIRFLISAHEDRLLTSDEVRKCMDDLQRSGRHIGQKHHQKLLDRLQ